MSSAPILLFCVLLIPKGIVFLCRFFVLIVYVSLQSQPHFSLISLLLHCGRHIHGNFLTNFPILFLIVVGNSQSNITTAQNNLWSDNLIVVRIVWLSLFVRFSVFPYCILLFVGFCCPGVLLSSRPLNEDD